MHVHMSPFLAPLKHNTPSTDFVTDFVTTSRHYLHVYLVLIMACQTANFASIVSIYLSTWISCARYYQLESRLTVVSREAKEKVPRDERT